VNIRARILKEASDKARWQAAEADGRGFVPMSGGGTVAVIDESRQALLALSRNFPGQFKRTMGKIGSLLRQRLRASIEAGGPAGTSWPAKAQLRQAAAGRASYAGRRKGSRRSYTKGDWGKMTRSLFGYASGDPRLSSMPYGRLHKAGRYRLAEDGHSVQIGWIGWSASQTFRAVQSGRRGGKGEFEFDESQPITRAMRRMFAAAGIKFAKGRRSIRQGQRPLVRKVFQQFEPELEGVVTKSMARYIAEGKSS